MTDEALSIKYLEDDDKKTRWHFTASWPNSDYRGGKKGEYKTQTGGDIKKPKRKNST